MTEDTERFIAAIRDTIAVQLGHLMTEHDRHDGAIHLPNEGTSIDLDALARAIHQTVVAIHQTVVNYQSPPF